MVAANLQAVLAGIVDIVAEVWRSVGSTFGCFHIHKLYALVAAHLVPVDIFLIARHVDAVVVSALTAALQLRLLSSPLRLLLHTLALLLPFSAALRLFFRFFI